ncbi:MAG: 2OG-Fe(II) oxygenase, partial [Deltaproteobacteria bacterium]|nr:2OG-Fe(II) oxygenase [Nannocystaceae bacterium]
MNAPWTPAHDAALDEHGWAVVDGLLDEGECERLIASWDDRPRFRKHVDMARHSFGRGEYRYFADPLPGPVQQLREDLYAALAPVANLWWERLAIDTRFPAT